MLSRWLACMNEKRVCWPTSQQVAERTQPNGGRTSQARGPVATQSHALQQALRELIAPLNGPARAHCVQQHPSMPCSGRAPPAFHDTSYVSASGICFGVPANPAAGRPGSGTRQP